MNYLDLCKGYVSELGIAGGTGPAAVTGQTGEMANVVRWIRDACLDIDNMWRDWRYLWCEYDVNVSNENVPPPALPANPPAREWNRDSLWINFGTSAAKQLAFVEWPRFRVMAAGGIASGQPTEFTEMPNRVIRLNRRPANVTPLHAEYWRRPPVLAANSDVPLMPDDYHRVIICRAAIMYGNREAAGEIINGMEAEYVSMIDKLQSDQIDAFRNDRMGGQDIPLQMEPQ